MPLDIDVAEASLRKPWVGAVTVSEANDTRMPSTRSSASRVEDGLMSDAVMATGAGSGSPVATGTMVSAPAISVSGGWAGSAPGTNSVTVPVTWSSAPTTAAGGTGEPVNTTMPSDVSGSASASASGVCRKKPFDFSAVTMPRVDTVAPARGDVGPDPWMAWIAVNWTSSLTIVTAPVSSATAAPATLPTTTANCSFGSTVVSPKMPTSKAASVAPSAMTWLASASGE